MQVLQLHVRLVLFIIVACDRGGSPRYYYSGSFPKGLSARHRLYWMHVVHTDWCASYQCWYALACLKSDNAAHASCAVLTTTTTSLPGQLLATFQLADENASFLPETMIFLASHIQLQSYHGSLSICMYSFPSSTAKIHAFSAQAIHLMSL